MIYIYIYLSPSFCRLLSIPIIVLANKCCVRQCDGGVRKAEQSNADLVSCVGIKGNVVQTKKCSHDICGSVVFDPPYFSSGSIHNDNNWESAISNICISNCF